MDLTQCCCIHWRQHHFSNWWQDGVNCSQLHQVTKLFSYYLLGLIVNKFRATKAHTGAYLAACIVECLREFGIDKKVCLKFKYCWHSADADTSRFWLLLWTMHQTMICSLMSYQTLSPHLEAESIVFAVLHIFSTLLLRLVSVFWNCDYKLFANIFFRLFCSSLIESSRRNLLMGTALQTMTLLMTIWILLSSRLSSNWICWRTKSMVLVLVMRSWLWMTMMMRLCAMWLLEMPSPLMQPSFKLGFQTEYIGSEVGWGIGFNL